MFSSITSTSTTSSSTTTTATTTASASTRTGAHTRAPAKAILRSSRACDQCRKLRIRCVRTDSLDACQNCSKRRFDCTASGPEHKRGPPRGYLHSLESRLHGAEALLGILISLPSPSIQSTLSSLARLDPQAAEILSKVNNSAFGPSGRALRGWLISAVGEEGSGVQLRRGTRLGLGNDTADLMMTQKTNRWQDHLIAQLSASSSSSSSHPPPSSPPSPSFSSQLPPQLHLHNPLPSPLFSFDAYTSSSSLSPTTSEWPLPTLFPGSDTGSPDLEDLNVPSPESFYSSSGEEGFVPSGSLFGVEL